LPRFLEKLDANETEAVAPIQDQPVAIAVPLLASPLVSESPSTLYFTKL
jgi:hypothetical protein